MGDLTRVYFKSPYGDIGYLDISNDTTTHTIPFTANRVKGGSFTVDATTTVYLQPNQLAYVTVISKVGSITRVALNFAGGTFVNKSVKTDLPSTFNIGMVGAQNIQFRYYNVVNYENYCKSRAVNYDDSCTYHSPTGLLTIPPTGETFMTGANPGTTIPMSQSSSDSSGNIPWWFVLIIGIISIIVLALVIFAGWYAFSRSKQPVYDDTYK